MSNYTSNIQGSSISLNYAKVEGVRILSSGELQIYVANYGKNPIKIINLYILSKNDEMLAKVDINLEVDPNSVEIINISSNLITSLISKGYTNIKLKLVTSSGTFIYSSLVNLQAKRAPMLMAFKAYRSATTYDNHWIIFNYINGSYFVYDNTSNNVRGPYKGTLVIINGTNEYKPPRYNGDRPIIVVFNPTNANRDWIFTIYFYSYTNPNTTIPYRFLLQKLNGIVQNDILIFWADLFDPYYGYFTVDSNNYRSEVVRVTFFENGSCRVANYMAAGAYKHEFYIKVNEFNPLKGQLVYVKEFGSGWSYAIIYNGTSVWIEVNSYIINSCQY